MQYNPGELVIVARRKAPRFVLATVSCITASPGFLNVEIKHPDGTIVLRMYKLENIFSPHDETMATKIGAK